MKVSVDLPDSLYRQAARRAAAHGMSLAALLEQALQHLLSEPAPQGPLAELPSRRGRGTRPDVDLLDCAAILELLESEGDHASVRR